VECEFNMEMTSFYLFLIISGLLGNTILVFLVAIFGRLIILQIKIWALARRGYHMVEHIGTNKVRTYYYLKPDQNKFDFNSGFYMHHPDTTTKTDTLLKAVPKDAKFSRLDKLDDTKEYEAMKEKINKLVYDVDAVTLRWGIPIITYYGKDPHPIDFKERTREFGAQVIKDMYIRILATQQYGLMQKMIIWMVVALFACALVGGLLYFAYNSLHGDLNMCIANWNTTSNAYQMLLNQSKVVIQNNTLII